MKITGNRNVEAPRRAAPTKSARKAEGVSSAQDTVTIAGVPQSELTPRVLQALSKLMEEVGELRHELAEANAKIAELSTLAFTDPLTGVYNRRAFVGELNRTLAIVERHAQAASVAYFDMDDMKAVNDTHGHAGGDAAIAHVASTIRANIRATDVVGRLGGDEFGVIFAYADNDATAGKVREIQSLIAETDVHVRGETFRVSVTAGVAPIKKGATVEATLDLADAEMYSGKVARKSPGRAAAKR